MVKTGEQQPDTNLLNVLTRAAEQQGAVLHGGVRRTYSDLVADAEGLARRIGAAASGGSVAALCLPPGPRLVEAVAATVLAGAGYLYLDPAWPQDHRRTLLTQSGASVLVEDDWTSGSGFSVRSLAAAPAAGDPSVAAGMACVIGTSGTTGKPRLAPMSHHPASGARIGTDQTRSR